jgi:hypothetical protein
LAAVTFCLASVLVWAISVRIYRLAFGDNLGLLSSLGPMYYVAVASAFVAVALVCSSRLTNWKIGLVSVFALQAELYLTPNFLWGLRLPYPQYLPNALSYSISTLISQQGGLNALFPSPLPWPGVWIFGSVLTQVIGPTNANIVGTMFAWLLLASDSLSFFAIMYRLFSKNLRLSMLGLLCFVIGAWTLPLTFNDVGFSASLFLVFLMLVFESGGKSTTWATALIVVTVVSIIIANPYAAFSTLGILAVYNLPIVQRDIHKRWGPLFVVGIVGFGLWYLLSGVDLLSAYAPLLQHLLNLGFLFGQLAAKYTGSAAHRLVILAGEALSAFLGLAAIIGAFKYGRFRSSLVDRKIAVTLVGLALALLVMGPAYALRSSITYSVVETIERSWTFGFFFIGYFMVRLLGKKHAVVFVILLGFLSPVCLLSNSGDLGLYHSPAEVYGGVYVEYHTPPAYVLEIDNFTTLDGLYCWQISCTSQFEPVQGTLSSNESINTGTIPSARQLTLISTSSHNAYLIDALTGNSTLYVSESALLLVTPIVDLIYSTVGMNVMAFMSR